MAMTEDDVKVAVYNLEADISLAITDFEAETGVVVDEIFVGRQGSILTGVQVEVINK